MDGIDIQKLMRSDVERRNWTRVHVTADRREAFELGDARRRFRGNREIVVRSQFG